MCSCFALGDAMFFISCSFMWCSIYCARILAACSAIVFSHISLSARNGNQWVIGPRRFERTLLSHIERSIGPSKIFITALCKHCLLSHLRLGFTLWGSQCLERRQKQQLLARPTSVSHSGFTRFDKAHHTFRAILFSVTPEEFCTRTLQ